MIVTMEDESMYEIGRKFGHSWTVVQIRVEGGKLIPDAERAPRRAAAVKLVNGISIIPLAKHEGEEYDDNGYLSLTPPDSCIRHAN